MKKSFDFVFEKIQIHRQNKFFVDSTTTKRRSKIREHFDFKRDDVATIRRRRIRKFENKRIENKNIKNNYSNANQLQRKHKRFFRSKIFARKTNAFAKFRKKKSTSFRRRDDEIIKKRRNSNDVLSINDKKNVFKFLMYIFSIKSIKRKMNRLFLIKIVDNVSQNTL